MVGVTILVAFLVVLSAAVAWKLFQLYKNPQNAPLRAVTLCLACAEASYPLAMPGGASGFDAVAGGGVAKLAQNALLLTTCYFLMCFYLYSATDDRTGRRRARWEGLWLIVAVGAITVAALSAPHQALVGSFSTADMTVPQVAIFYLIAGMYLFYTLAAAFWWTLRYARLSLPPLSTGLWLAAFGLAGMAAACVVRAAFVVARSQGGAVSAALTLSAAVVLMLSVFLFVIGVSYPGVRNRLAAVVLWRRHRRIHRRLHPLWSLLTEAFPHVVLPVAESRHWRSLWHARGVHRHYHRRIIECRDGLIQIGPYLEELDGEDEASSDSAPERAARRLRRAADTHLNDPAGAARPALLAMPRQGDRDADVQQLVALSDALYSMPLTNVSERELRC